MKLLRLFEVLFFPAIYSPLSLAQTETGAVSGTVTDPTGNLLQGASITLTSTATRATRSSISNAEGFYTITNVQPGLYELGIGALGFSTLTRQVEITVASRLRGDAQLKMEGAKTSVEVLGEGGVQVETQTQTLSQVVTGRQVTELPTLTRNPYDLVAIAGNISTEDPTGRGVRLAINGQRYTYAFKAWVDGSSPSALTTLVVHLQCFSSLRGKSQKPVYCKCTSILS